MEIDIEFFRKRLLELQQELLKRYLDISSRTSTSSNERPSDIIDLASDSFEDDLAAALSENEAKELASIRRALQQMDNNEYGKCEECSGNIGHERLDARPFATLCLTCKQEMERLGS